MQREATNGHNVEDQSQFPITVDLPLNSNEKTKAKAFADVSVSLGSMGVIKILGFSLYANDGRAVRFVQPARKGSSKWFEILSLVGGIQQQVHTAVEAEYNRQKSL